MSAAFEDSRAEIQGKDIAARTNIAKQYLKNLGAIEARYKNSGDLDSLLATRNESQRYLKEKTLDNSNTAPDVAELNKLMEAYAQRFAQNKLATSRSIHALASQMDNSLDTLQGKYTQVGMIEEAIKVKNRRAEMERLDYIAEAKAMVENDAEERNAERMERARLAKENTVETPAPGDLANQFKGSDKKRIGDRYDEFIDTIADEKLDESVKLINPIKTEKAGTGIFVGVLKAFVPGVKIAKKFGANFRTGKITLAPDGLSAVQIPLYDGPDKRNDMDPVKWVKIEGDWYLEL
jgi:hypothetical protein